MKISKSNTYTLNHMGRRREKYRVLSAVTCGGDIMKQVGNTYQFGTLGIAGNWAERSPIKKGREYNTYFIIDK